VSYKDKKISDLGFRLDLLVESSVIVELKSVEKVSPVHKKQLLTYLHLANKELGLLINFNEALLKHGITRITTAPPKRIAGFLCGLCGSLAQTWYRHY
jgi:GxxExxY protein